MRHHPRQVQSRTDLAWAPANIKVGSDSRTRRLVTAGRVSPALIEVLR